MSLVTIGELSVALDVPISQLRRLTNAGVLPAIRTPGGHRRYDLDQVRTAYVAHVLGAVGDRLVAPAPTIAGEVLVSDRDSRAADFDHPFPLAGLEENLVWEQVRSCVQGETGQPALSVAQYAFTEMVNNAIDHSGGAQVRIRAWRLSHQLVFEITDDGSGVFGHMRAELGLGSDFEAIQELTKGKRTTAPDRHTGEGIFFTSKAVRLFGLSANGISWFVDNERGDVAVGASSVRRGTQVLLEIDPAADLELSDLFGRYSHEFQFTRSRPVVKLFTMGVVFISRSEAKRVLSGMESFTDVELDFEGVDSVGQGFVDEALRVWPSLHPGTSITPTNMNSAVEFMVRRGLPPAST